MRHKGFFINSAIFDFISLAPKSFIFILIGSTFSGILQSASILAIMPLMEYLGMVGNESNNVLFVKYFKNMTVWLGIDNSIASILGFMVFTTLSVAIIGFLINAYNEKVSAKITRELRVKILNAITNAKWLYFIKAKTGSVVHSVITETAYSVACYKLAIRIFSLFIQSIFLLIAAFFVSPIISISVIALGIIFFFTFQPWFLYAKQIGERTDELFRTINVKITDGIQGLKPLKVMNTQRYLFSIMKKLTIQLEKEQVKGFMAIEIPTVARNILPTMIVALGVYLAIQYSLVPLISLVPMIVLFRTAITRLNMVQTQIQKLKAKEPFYFSLKKSLTEVNKMKQQWKGTLDPSLNESIMINNIYFSYEIDNILSDVSLEIKKGSFSAIMGESGGGKTTFSDIICGLIMPDSGEILIDGNDLKILNINKWQQMIGYVPQDIYLFNDTIMQNITLGDSSVGEEDVVEALKDSGSWKFVKVLPDGMNTIVGERGSRFSGGQKQRLSIARAILRKPQLLILDEATTALDPATEKRILNTIRKLTDGGITTFAVSHQPAVLEVADHAYKLGKGKLFKLGNENKIEVT